MPVGTSNGLLNGINKGVKKGDSKVKVENEKGRRASESAALSSNDNSGDEDVHHTYIIPKPALPAPYHVPPRPDEQGSPPTCRSRGRRKVDDAKTDDNHPEDDNHTQQPSRHPVDMMDSDKHRPSEPTEPLDEEKGAQRENGKVRGTLTVEEVESN
ncbi:hypothetical protein PAXINDRAFT_5472 [Paxillus involutus ATCC 200175]|nr:hypothetical protein PAXINDRAFT_5472 [Paxillus involutus ATCC 200175]